MIVSNVVGGKFNMKIILTLIIVVCSSVGCRSANVVIKDNDYEQAIIDRNNPPVRIRRHPDSDIIRINCRGEKKSMQDCIDAANDTCPKGWVVHTYKNDNTGTLETIRANQVETKNTSFGVGGGDQYSRDMTVSCK